MILEVGYGPLFHVVDQRDDLCPRFQELLVLLRQPTEMPSAEWSHEAPQKDEDDAGPAPKLAERDLTTPCGRECEIWRFRSDWNQPGFNRHGMPLGLARFPETRPLVADAPPESGGWCAHELRQG